MWDLQTTGIPGMGDHNNTIHRVEKIIGDARSDPISIKGEPNLTLALQLLIRAQVISSELRR